MLSIQRSLNCDGMRHSLCDENSCTSCLDLYGANESEQARSDMIAGCSEDVLQAISKCMQGTDAEKVGIHKRC